MLRTEVLKRPIRRQADAAPQAMHGHQTAALPRQPGLLLPVLLSVGSSPVTLVGDKHNALSDNCPTHEWRLGSIQSAARTTREAHHNLLLALAIQADREQPFESRLLECNSEAVIDSLVSNGEVQKAGRRHVAPVLQR